MAVGFGVAFGVALGVAVDLVVGLGVTAPPGLVALGFAVGLVVPGLAVACVAVDEPLATALAGAETLGSTLAIPPVGVAGGRASTAGRTRPAIRM